MVVLFNTSSNCSFHLFCLSSSLVRIFPSFSFNTLLLPSFISHWSTTLFCIMFLALPSLLPPQLLWSFRWCILPLVSSTLTFHFSVEFLIFFCQLACNSSWFGTVHLPFHLFSLFCSFHCVFWYPLFHILPSLSQYDLFNFIVSCLESISHWMDILFIFHPSSIAGPKPGWERRRVG